MSYTIAIGERNNEIIYTILTRFEKTHKISWVYFAYGNTAIAKTRRWIIFGCFKSNKINFVFMLVLLFTEFIMGGFKYIQSCQFSKFTKFYVNFI